MFRFITPVLVTMTIFILGMVLSNQGKLEDRFIDMQKETRTYFTNHLSEHKDFCIAIEHRLTKIESTINGHQGTD